MPGGVATCDGICGGPGFGVAGRGGIGASGGGTGCPDITADGRGGICASGGGAPGDDVGSLWFGENGAATS